MQFIKKWGATLLSALASIFTFIFLALPAWGTKLSYLGLEESETFTGYSLIAGKMDGEAMFQDYTAWHIYKVFAIVLIILAVLLALYAILMLLVNLNVIKLKLPLTLINNIALSIMALVSVIALIAVLSINSAVAKELDCTVKELKEIFDFIGAKAGLWLVTGLNILACACGWIFNSLKESSK